ncbi:MAG: ABC transporter ATP-binding protein [Acidobacteriota bacterium]
MAESPIVELQNVSLRYRLARQKVPSFKEFIIHAATGGLSYTDLWALSDIDLTIERGEVLGVVGRNGAGKSTLSKVISGVLKPTKGARHVRGKVSPILELGTGFDPELTGIENVYLNALLRGHRRTAIDVKLDSIVEFSGLKDFVHSPVRNYSTGMVARLGFAVATAWKPDVLVLDEVLSVGDASFLGRCHERIRSFCNGGTTVLIVSHSPQEILTHCSRSIWLQEGRIVMEGSPRDVLGAYATAAGDTDTQALLQATAPPAETPSVESSAPEAPTAATA